jgi:hypothetical protein
MGTSFYSINNLDIEKYGLLYRIEDVNKSLF